MKKPLSWTEIAELLNLLRDTLGHEWGMTLPPFGTLPNEALEQAVDEWCRELSKNPSAPLSPPPMVRPWILARVLCFGSVASCLAESEPEERLILDANMMEQFLVHEWHGHLRSLWPLVQPPES